MLTDKELESIARKGSIELFDMGGKKFKPALLPISDTDEWLTKARGVDIARLTATAAKDKAEVAVDPEAAAPLWKDADDKRKEYTDALRDVVFEYDAKRESDKDAENNVPLIHLIEAFASLKAVTDPFVISERQEQQEMKNQLADLPPGLMEKAMEAGLLKQRLSQG